MKNKNMIIFENYKTRTPGVWYFIPNNLDDYKKKKPTHGFGVIKYAEGSVYTGEIYFDGKNYNKLGFGQQEFTSSFLGEVDSNINERKYLYVGSYDYRKTDWIYGNGVLYYKDLDGKPSRFIKGFFCGLDLLKPYTKEFDYSCLIDGYTREMESNYNPRKELFKNEKKYYELVEDLDTLFVGDSYFEFWYNEQFADISFKKAFDLKRVLNVGLGGTKFVDWFEYIPLLSDIKEPKNIVVNLGFNDLHSNYSPNKVFNDFKKFLKMFKELFPNSNYYFLNVVHAPGFTAYYARENELNKLIERYAKKNGLTIIHNSEAIANKQQEEHCFDMDDCHLNPTGYIIMKNLIKEIVK